MNNYFKKVFVSLLIVFAGVVVASACDVTVNTDKNIYSVGDIAVVELIIEQDHRRCPYEDELPEVKVRNVKAVSKSDFIEIKNGVWKIQYKFQITGSNAAVKFIRNCSKGGFDKTVKFNVKE